MGALILPAGRFAPFFKISRSRHIAIPGSLPADGSSCVGNIDFFAHERLLRFGRFVTWILHENY